MRGEGVGRMSEAQKGCYKKKFEFESAEDSCRTAGLAEPAICRLTEPANVSAI